MEHRNLYEILGVSRDVSASELKKAYHRLAKKYHPDMNAGNPQAEEKFKEVNGAFEVLSDPRKRSLYDELGDDALRIGFDPEKARAYREWKSAPTGRGAPQGGFGGFEFGDDIDLGDIFSSLFGGMGGMGGMGARGGRRVSRAPSRGSDVNAELEVTLRELIQGGQRQLSLQLPDRQAQLTVTIPKGVADGSRIRLAGQGARGPGGGPPGDLYLTLRLASHPQIRREGLNLTLPFPITVKEALEGGEVLCPTFDGEVTVKIPAHAQSGNRLRFKGRGLPGPSQAPRGDFYLELRIIMPEKPSATALKLAEELEGAYDGNLRAHLSL